MERIENSNIKKSGALFVPVKDAIKYGQDKALEATEKAMEKQNQNVYTRNSNMDLSNLKPLNMDGLLQDYEEALGIDTNSNPRSQVFDRDKSNFIGKDGKVSDVKGLLGNIKNKIVAEELVGNAKTVALTGRKTTIATNKGNLSFESDKNTNQVNIMLNGQKIDDKQVADLLYDKVAVMNTMKLDRLQALSRSSAINPEIELNKSKNKDSMQYDNVK